MLRMQLPTDDWRIRWVVAQGTASESHITKLSHIHLKLDTLCLCLSRVVRSQDLERERTSAVECANEHTYSV